MLLMVSIILFCSKVKKLIIAYLQRKIIFFTAFYLSTQCSFYRHLIFFEI